jgi:hypothetical protein
MATEAEKLQAQIDALEAARMAGVQEIFDQNGERLRYASGTDMATALANAERRLLALTKQPVNTIKFHTCKGLWNR